MQEVWLAVVVDAATKGWVIEQSEVPFKYVFG